MSSDPDDRFDEDRPSDPNRFQEARSAVSVPATLLIVVGALGMLYTALELIQLPSLPAQLEQSIATIDADPNLTRDQKDLQIDILNSVKDAVQQPIALVFYIVNIVCSTLILIGGIRMMRLSGPALPTISAVFAMIPCTFGCCCILGFPIGIYALVVLYRPSVRAAMADRNASPLDPDDPEMR